MATFYKEITTCPICKTEFTYTKIMSSAIKVKSYDKDLKPNYADYNPFMFSIITCTNCKFTYNERDKDKIKDNISPKKFDLINKYLSTITEEDILKVDNSENKSPEFYKQQLVMGSEIYSILKQPFEVAKLLLKLAWHYRDIGDEKRELKILNNVLKISTTYFEEAYTDEDTIFALFYSGYISYRFENLNDAAKYLDRLNSKYKNFRSPYLKAAKELRGELR